MSEKTPIPNGSEPNEMLPQNPSPGQQTNPLQAGSQIPSQSTEQPVPATNDPNAPQPIQEPILTEPQQAVGDNSRSKMNEVARNTAGALIVAGGLLIGLFVGFAANFCIKDCDNSPLKQSLIILAPLGSLLITVPISRHINKK